MAATAIEEGVLKLVHPGRRVEIHLQPILAAEVMKMNPRHSVTRPDIFDFPFVVVRPESLLLPGKVFLIVPNRTIYKLTKQYETRQRLTQQSPTAPNDKSTAGVTPKHQNLKKPTQPAKDIVLHRSSVQMSTEGVTPKHENVTKDIVLHRYSAQKSTTTPRERESEKRTRRQSQVGCWPETWTAGDEKSKCTRNRVSGLKPCLRKHGHGSDRNVGRRVTFDLPEKDEE